VQNKIETATGIKSTHQLINEHVGPLFVIPSLLVTWVCSSYAFSWILELLNYQATKNWFDSFVVVYRTLPMIMLFAILPVLLTYLPTYWALYHFKKRTALWFTVLGFVCAGVIVFILFEQWKVFTVTPIQIDRVLQDLGFVFFVAVSGAVGGYAAYLSLCCRIAHLRWRGRLDTAHANVPDDIESA